jgi:hypothetical protein
MKLIKSIHLATIAFAAFFTLSPSTARAEEKPATQLIRNGSFQDVLQNWELQQIAPAQGDVSMVQEGPDGSRCAKVILITPGDEHWKMSLFQTGLSVKAAKTYKITFMAKGSEKRWVSVDFKQHLEPYTGLGGKYDVEIGTTWTPVTVTIKPTADEANTRFSIGNLGMNKGTLWFTNFSITEEPAAP